MKRPHNKLHDKIRQIHRVKIPQGALNVDPAALQRARQGVPKGDLHNG